MENKLGTNYLRAFLMFCITLIVTGVEIATGKFGRILFRVGKALTILSTLGTIGRNWAILKEEIDDLNDDEIEDLSNDASRELDIVDSETARALTRKGIDIAKNIVGFVDDLRKIGKLPAITGMIALLMLFNVNVYAQASPDSARVVVFTATKTNAVYVNQTFASQATGIFFQAPDATLYMTRGGVEYRVLKTRVQGRGEQGNVDDFFKNQFILRAKDTVRFRTDGGNALIYFILRRTTSTGQ
jgi:hypothetical protein